MDLSIDAVAVGAITEASDWWQEVNTSAVWQDRIFHTLAALFGLVSAVALIQLVRIECRVPEYGWTTQKVFHFLNFVVNAVRSVVFVFRRDVQQIKPEIFQHVLLDTPSLLFFTTYALLVLFWAEIYYQARAVSTDGLRPSFYIINSVVYSIQSACLAGTLAAFPSNSSPMRHIQLEGLAAHKLFFVVFFLWEGLYILSLSFDDMVPLKKIRIPMAWVHSMGIQIAIWLILWWKPIQVMVVLSKLFFAGVSLFAALGFLLYGGRLFLMLQRFPVESKGRRKKLQEVGYVTAICFSCFLLRCIMMFFNAFDKAANLDVLNHPVLNFLYYMLVEILPSSLVLFVLRKLPPKRGITQYHPIR